MHQAAATPPTPHRGCRHPARAARRFVEPPPRIERRPAGAGSVAHHPTGVGTPPTLRPRQLVLAAQLRLALEIPHAVVGARVVLVPTEDDGPQCRPCPCRYLLPAALLLVRNRLEPLAVGVGLNVSPAGLQPPDIPRVPKCRLVSNHAHRNFAFRFRLGANGAPIPGLARVHSMGAQSARTVLRGGHIARDFDQCRGANARELCAEQREGLDSASRAQVPDARG